MARVTVEDCIDKVSNRFELVMMAAQRARKIGSGSPLLVDRDNDKNPVVALREIADEKVQISAMKEELIRSHQRIVESDDTEEVIDMMEGEEEWNRIASEGFDFGGASDFSDEDLDEDDGEEGSLEDMAGITDDL